MASRRLLRSVVDGTASAFASRNNDIDGWWVMGLLLEDLPPGEPDLRIDLLSGSMAPVPNSALLADLGPAWAEYFSWSVARHGVSYAKIVSASLDVRFDRTLFVTSWAHIGRDRLFSCVVTLADDHGREYRGVGVGQCTTGSDAGSVLHRSTTRDMPRIRERAISDGRH